MGGWSTIHPTWGRYTFAGLFDLARLSPRAQGLYTDQMLVDREPYNIYTVFRGLIQDFTLPGALAFVGAIGFLAQLVYARVRSGLLTYSAFLAAFYAFTVWSFITDIFIYNTIIASFLVLATYLRIAQGASLHRVSVTLDSPWLQSRLARAPPPTKNY